jgi:hypothetical protein
MLTLEGNRTPESNCLGEQQETIVPPGASVGGATPSCSGNPTDDLQRLRTASATARAFRESGGGGARHGELPRVEAADRTSL